MNKVFLILKREYLEIVKTKMFIISTLLTPLFMVGIMVVPILLTQFRTGTPEKIAILDNTGIGLFEDIKERIEELSPRPGYELIKKEADLYRETEMISSLRKQVLDRELDAYIILDRDILETGNVSYYSQNVANFSTQGLFSETINKIVISKRFKLLDIEQEILDRNLETYAFQVLRVSREGETIDKGQSFIISYIFILIIYMTILMYGVTVLRGVIQEKSSKVIEIVISNIKPFHLLLGKVFGIGSVGLTQYIVWALLGYLAVNNMGQITNIFGMSGAEIADTSEISQAAFNLPPYVFAYLVIFFTLGYFLYSTLYAAIGAMVDNEQEANYIQAPLIGFLIIPMLVIPMVAQNPDSTISVILSLFPFFTPMLMFLRINIMMPPVHQIILSIIFMIIAILLSTYIAAKIYRVGILMHGKKPSFKEVMKWLKYN